MGWLGGRIAVAGAALAFGACPASALADEFIAAPEAPLKVVSGTAGEQRFQLGPFTISCAAAKGSGAVTGPQTISADVRFSHCEDSTQLGGETLSSPVSFVGRLGFVWTASGLTAIQRFSIKVKAPRCVIVAGHPESPGGAGVGKISVVAGSSYAEELDSSRNLRLFPTGFQHKLAIETRAEQIEVNYEGACADFATSEEGTYSGTFIGEAVRGDLEGSGEGWNRVKNKQEG
jgi:hypothetical protein